MKWFKFFGGEYLSDPKVLSLNAEQRACWITLLCLASVNDNAEIRYIDNDRLLSLSGVVKRDDTRADTIKTFQNLEMITVDNGKITVKNWQKRQNTHLTGYERVKRWREKKRNDNAMITSDKNRIDKSREEDTRKVSFTPKDMEMVDLLIDLISKNNPAWVMRGNKDTWAEDVNKIHRLDSRTYEQIEYMIRWVQQDSFWSQNILSASKLREKFNDLIPKLKKIKSHNQPNYVL
jgi:hypothetical protein